MRVRKFVARVLEAAARAIAPAERELEEEDAGVSIIGHPAVVLSPRAQAMLARPSPVAAPAVEDDGPAPGSLAARYRRIP